MKAVDRALPAQSTDHARRAMPKPLISHPLLHMPYEIVKLRQRRIRRGRREQHSGQRLDPNCQSESRGLEGTGATSANPLQLLEELLSAQGIGLGEPHKAF